MTSKDEHQKHPPLSRPGIGNYHRCEWGIYGTGCSDIESFYKKIEAYLNPEFCTVYVDADHREAISGQRLQVGKKIYSSADEIAPNPFYDKLSPISADAVFVNGNHFPASRQIVFLNPEKEASLKRRSDQLTNIHILIKEREEQEVFEFLKEKIHDDTIVLSKDKLDKVLDLIKSDVTAKISPIKALILAGGKSTRMGSDKSQLIYEQGETQELKMARLCDNIGLESFISKGASFEHDEIEAYPVIKDRLMDMGPFGAIVSAFMHDPNAAWLVLACDLPFIDEATLRRLIESRNSSGVATAYKAENRPFPEPLITIYEPKAYRQFLDFMSLGYSCPRKVIINSDTLVLELEDQEVIKNVNTPEDLEEARKRIAQDNG